MEELAEFDRSTVTDMAVKQFTELYNKVNEKDLDMTRLELVLRNAFGAGVQWADAVHEKETKRRKSYKDGLNVMRNRALDAYLDSDGYDDFEAALSDD